MTEESRPKTDATEGEGTRRTVTAQERLLLLDLWQRSGLTAREFGALVGVSRHTLFLWKKRFDRPKNATPEEMQRYQAARSAANKAAFDTLVAVQKFVPPLWVPYGALGLAEHRVLPALLGILGCAGLGALGLRRAYRSTV